MTTSTLTLAPPFASGMVLQRNRTTSIAGRDQPNQRITLLFRDQRIVTTAAADGSWQVQIDTGDAGGPFDLSVTGSVTLVIDNVLVGEVWLASGQSNMQWRMDQCGSARTDIANMEPSLIRFFTVAQKASRDPLNELEGAWVELNPSTAHAMSAVGFYFAQKLWKELRVPVGILVSAWGGTPAETWTPLPAYDLNDTTRAILNTFDSTKDRLDELRAEAVRNVDAWEAENLPADPGNTKLSEGWAEPGFDDRNWRTMPLPGFWQGQPDMDFNGIVWFRKTVEIPADWRGRVLELSLGPIDDFDDTYINGERVGGMGKGVFQAYCQPRVYPVPAHLTRNGRITVTVRAFDHFGAGGFTGREENMWISLPGESTIVPLAGTWAYEVEHRFRPPPDLFATYPNVPNGLLPEHRPAHVFNAMIHPLRHATFAGVIWYQGESNGGRSAQYADLFRALIEGWRAHFMSPALPFLFVQLPNFGTGADWPFLREAQEKALALPATGMAVTIDVGTTTDIHPQNKGPVGERLALQALRQVYHREAACDSPACKRIDPEQGRVRVWFDPTYGGLMTADGQPPRGFMLAGPDGVYLPANAWIESDVVVVESPSVPSPRGIRYAFIAEPQANLVGRTGLPAAPFRVDDLSAVTPGS